jgi:hypothetical protein
MEIQTARRDRGYSRAQPEKIGDAPRIKFGERPLFFREHKEV